MSSYHPRQQGGAQGSDERNMGTNVTSVAAPKAGGSASSGAKEHLNDDRGLVSYIVLNIIIYVPLKNELSFSNYFLLF